VESASSVHWIFCSCWICLKCRDAPYLLLAAIEEIHFFGEAFGASLHATKFKREDRKDRKEDAKSKSAARLMRKRNGRWETGGMGDHLLLHNSAMYRTVALFLDGAGLGGIWGLVIAEGLKQDASVAMPFSGTKPKQNASERKRLRNATQILRVRL
jgi:hypothetical protein